MSKFKAGDKVWVKDYYCNWVRAVVLFETNKSEHYVLKMRNETPWMYKDASEWPAERLVKRGKK